MVRDHQSREAVFKSILPEDIDWKPFCGFSRNEVFSCNEQVTVHC
jgi:hypothetical protein